MFAQTRQKHLLELLEREGQLDVKHIQCALGASPATIRRDLAHLSEKGLVVRTHGGVIHPAFLQGEPIFQQRAEQNPKIKEALAAQAVKDVSENAVVFIDAGTSALAVGRLLIGRSDLILVTNSIPFFTAGAERRSTGNGDRRRSACSKPVADGWLRS